MFEHLGPFLFPAVRDDTAAEIGLLSEWFSLVQWHPNRPLVAFRVVFSTKQGGTLSGHFGAIRFNLM
jgi:hypothetical protein